MKALEIKETMDPGEMTKALKEFIEEFGTGFHPDTRAEAYFNTEIYTLVFTKSECFTVDKSVKILFDTFGDKLYDICCAIFKSMEEEITYCCVCEAELKEENILVQRGEAYCQVCFDDYQDRIQDHALDKITDIKRSLKTRYGKDTGGEVFQAIIDHEIMIRNS